MTLERKLATIAPKAGEEPATFLSQNVQQLAAAITKARDMLNATKGEIGTIDQLIKVNWVASEAMTPLSSPQPTRCLECHCSGECQFK
uniref:Uncharacterized protein n=1 Tax=Romanomermis culicivorax TaxID=13658 RepID=A0A915ITS9_ROMCU